MAHATREIDASVKDRENALTGTMGNLNVPVSHDEYDVMDKEVEKEDLFGRGRKEVG